MPLDPQTQSIFDELKGRSSAPRRRLDPATQGLFDELKAQGRRSQPAPIVVQGPAPAPPPPVQPVMAAIAGPAPAQEPAKQGFSLWKALSIFADPFTATLNEAARAGYESEARGEGALGTAGAMLGAA